MKERETRNRPFRGWTEIAFLGALCLLCGAACAQEPALKFRFDFAEAAGDSTASDSSKGGLGFVLHSLDRQGAPAGCEAVPGAGPAHRGGALHLSRRAPRPGRGAVVATATNACLGFGQVRALTATLWFKQDTLAGWSRLFLLGTAGDTLVPGGPDSLDIELLGAGGVQFRVNGVAAAGYLPFCLPTNQWLFAALVYDGANVLGYLGAESMRATRVATIATPGHAVGFGTNGAFYLGNGPHRILAFDGWLADARFYAGAGDDRFIERIRQAAVGAGRPPGEPHPRGSEVSEVADTLASTQGVWLAVTAPAFRAALEPLIECRRAEGLRVLVVETTEVLSPEEIWLSQAAPLAGRIQRLLGSAKGPGYVLLAGTAGTPDPSEAQRIVVPAVPGCNGVMRSLPSDYAYGLPRRDGDGECAAAVGRFPARTPEEMQAMVRKTLDLEQNSRRPGAWRSRLALIQGNPGAGVAADMFVEQLLTQRLGRLHPAWSLNALFDLSCSAFYCPTPALHDAARDCFLSGALFSVYMGHSGGECLWSANLTFFSRNDWAVLTPRPGQGLFLSCGCFGCEWRGEDGYCHAAMRDPGGPAAVIGATAVSYGAAGLLAGDGLLKCLAHAPFPSRLADYWLAVQAGLARGPIDTLTFRLLDHGDGTDGKVPLAMQRLEDLEMWMLLGDPALRLPVVPVDVSLDIAGPVRAGQGLVVKGTVPAGLAGAALRVTLERPLASRPVRLEPLPPDTPTNRAARIRIAQENRAQANQFVLASAAAVADGQHFECDLAVPKLSWPEVVVRAVAEKGDESAQGVAVLSVGGK